MPAAEVVIVTAAEVDGHVVIAADAPAATADALRAEIERLLASITRL